MSRVHDMSRVSILEHTQDPNTDQLYEPLRQALRNPFGSQKNLPLTPNSMKKSFVSKDYRYLSEEEVWKLEQNIHIPVNTHLEPTNNLQPVRNEQFRVINMSQRVVGPPITAEEMQIIRSKGLKQSAVLYEMRDPQFKTIVQSKHQVVAPIKPEPTINTTTPPSPSPFERFGTYGKANPKYNLFSAIDHPVNNWKDYGTCLCGSGMENQIIASDPNPLTLNWK